ncbi:branched-chain amino acid aminotransferase [bacterium]|nr:branched-chain amino acid aminotransferase [bacterium]
MTTLAAKLWADEAGFIVSAELVLVSTILVLSMSVGMSEVSFAVNQELADVASAFGSINQSYRYGGMFDATKATIAGSRFGDHSDFCDSQSSIAGTGAQGESR